MIRTRFSLFFGWLLLAWLVLPGRVEAQRVATVPTDSARLSRRVERLPDVQVIGLRTSRYAVGTSAYTLDSAALSQFRGSSLAEALAARTPLYFKSYGPGQLASVSIRGTSARHTAVLWNGFNINLSALGEADFSLLTAGGNRLVRVQPGPGSALYGTGAVGGAVLLSGQPEYGGGLRGSLQGDAGSFGLGGGSAELAYGTARLALRTTAVYREAQNNFRLAGGRAGAPATFQQNAAYQQWNFTQDVRLRLGQRGQLALAAWLSGANRQVQPALGLANRHGREQDQSTRLLAEYRQQHGRYEGVARVAYSYDFIRYGDDTLEPQNTDLATTQAQTEHTFTFGSRANLRLGAEAQHFAAVVDGYATAVAENRFAGFALLRYDPRPALRLSLNLRQAAVPGQRPPFAPSAGVEWDVRTISRSDSSRTQRLTLKASAARSYRAATLNERYWPTGNPFIRPETGWGAEAGLRYESQLQAGWHYQAELTAHHQRVDDWVQWVPTPAGFSPRNLRLVRTRGLELTTSLSKRTRRLQTTVRATYAFLQTVKLQGYAGDAELTGRQLPYVPLHAATISAEATWHRQWLLSAGLNGATYRYTDTGTDDFLPAYALVQAGLGRYFDCRPLRLALLVQGYNLGNSAYQTYGGRAMPPRAWLLSLRIENP